MTISEFIVGQNLSAFTPIKYSLKLIELLYNDTIYTSITNTKYEGIIKDSGDRVRVRTAGKITLSAYTKGMKLVRQELTPTTEDLIIDQQYYFSFGVDSIDSVQNDVNAVAEYAANSKRDMAEMLDTDILAYARKNVLYSNMVGTNYSTGTASVAATTGVVTGHGTVFTAAMVGGIIKFLGKTNGYYVSAYTSNTAITVTDQGSTSYTGGVITEGADAGTYTIYGATPVAVTKANIYEQLVALSTRLNAAKSPRDGRWIVINSAVEGILRSAPEFIPAVQSAYTDVVQKGLLGSIAGFKVFSSELVDGNNTASTGGYWILAGTKDFISFACQIMKVSVVPEGADPQSFITTVKGLLVWGRKVFEGNKALGAAMRVTVS